MAKTRRRVADCGTDYVGKIALRLMRDRPDLKLVIHVHSAEKSGKDTGELIDAPPIIGVITRVECDELLNIKPDLLAKIGAACAKDNPCSKPGTADISHYVRHDLGLQRSSAEPNAARLDRDVITEITFATRDDDYAMLRALADPVVRDPIVEDDALFAIRSAILSYVAEEGVSLVPSGGCAK